MTGWRSASPCCRSRRRLDSIRPDLDGNEIMRILDVGPGPVIGKAYGFLLELRLEHGPMERRPWWQRSRSGGRSRTEPSG